jgi:hypothetical protein
MLNVRSLIMLMLLLLSFLPQAPLAAVSGADSTKVAQATQQIYELGLLPEYAQNTSESMQDIIAQLTENRSGDAYAQIVLENFSADVLQAALRQSLERNYDAGHASRSIAHLRQPSVRQLMQRLYDNDVNLQDEAIQSDFEQFVRQADRAVDQESPAASEMQQRIRLMADILNASRKIRLTVQSLEEMLAVVVFAVNKTLPSEEQLSDEALNELLLTLRENFQAFFEDTMLYTSLYAARAISVETMQRHYDFLTSESGRWFIRSYNNAVLDGFSMVGEDIAEALARQAVENAQRDGTQQE